MKRAVLLASVVMLAAGFAAAQSPLDGTWKIKLDTAQLSQKADVFEVKDGKWTCPTCLAKGPIAADGKDHKISGSPYIDTMSVKIVDDRHVETASKRAGKPVATSKYSVSEDGNTLTNEFQFISAANGQEGNGRSILKRVGAAPKSGNQVSGEWKADKIESISDNATTMTYGSSGDEVNYKAGTGESYTAKLDGKDYPMKGDPGSDTVSLKLIDDNTLQETYKKGGKAVYVSTMKVAADHNSMEVTGEDKRRGTVDKATAVKQ